MFIARQLHSTIPFFLCMFVFITISEANAGQKHSCSAIAPPLKAGEKLQLISDDFLFLEGPTWSKQHNVFFFSQMDFNGPQTNGPTSTIFTLTLPNTISTFKENSGSNGLLADSNELYVMNHSSRSVSRINLSTQKEVLLIETFQNLTFNSPNDIVKARNGMVYFTDPDWQLSNRKQGTPYTGVYSLSENGEITLIDKTLEKPNGIALSPDNKTLYVGDYSNRVSTYKVSKNGVISNREEFININSPDGMAVDCAGNLYVASHNEGIIYIYSPKGKPLDKIAFNHKITNMAFGGKTLTTLLITTAQGLYTLEVNIAGL